MIFLYSWLKDFVALPDNAEELGERLTMSGVEVEAVIGLSSEITKVSTARILSMEKHPNADRLKLCVVDDGTQRFDVVCGANNMKAGDNVLFAHHGARLKDGFKIKKSKIRGVVSNGMLCSETELGLSDQSEGIMILDADVEPGIDMNDLIGAGETKLDIGITPNRPDLFSVSGLAREIAAITGQGYQPPEVSLEEDGQSIDDLLKVRVEAPRLCPRYTARVITDVSVGPSPDWMQKRLIAHSIRPINNVVDITNYVLLELGQPLHAFDHALIAGSELVVRTSVKGESVITLDSVERKLNEPTLLITDGERAQALAGIMGAKDSQVSPATKTIVLESAWFETVNIRRTSRRMGLSSESSFIFERGIDIAGVPVALDRAASLMVEICGASVAKGKIDIYDKPKTCESVYFRVARASAILGTSLKEDEVRDIFTRLGLEVSSTTVKGEFLVTPPSYRGDIVAEIDLIEEVARFRGYDVIEPSLPTAPFTLGSVSKDYTYNKKIKQCLVSAGFNEVINYSFVSEKCFAMTDDIELAIRIKNPLSEDLSVLRPSLLPSLLENLKRNLAQKINDVNIFELATVFSLDGTKCSERSMLCGLLYGNRYPKGWTHKDEAVDFYDLKGIIESLLDSMGLCSEKINVAPCEGPLFHPTVSAAFKIAGKAFVKFARLHPSKALEMGLKGEVYLFELDMTGLVDIFNSNKRFEVLSKYPASTRDIAFVIDSDIEYQKIFKSIKGLDRKVIEMVELFDVYYGDTIKKGKRSLAIRVTYRLEDRTLKFSEVDEIHSTVVSNLETKFSAEIRVQ